MFDVPPKCPALANKLTGIFGWRHTYKVAAKHEGIQHTFLQKSYSLTLPKRPSSPYRGQKEPDSWVAVHHLQTQSGILDPDDCVGDVADDREQILASYDDSGPDPGVPQGGGDGASGSSSVGTGSPDIFRDPTNTDAPTNGQRGDVSTPHIEVTSTTACPVTGLGLQVRRSSDPNLLASLKAEGGNKRWSAAAPHCGGDSPDRVLLDKTGYLAPQWEEEDDGQQHSANAPSQQPFARSGRLSMQFLGDGTGYKWIEAAEKLQHQQHPHQQQQQHPQQQSSHQYAPQGQMYTTKSLPRESKRKEPLGQAYESIREKDGEMLLIINEYGSPLGLTAIPDNEHGGGLLVQHVEPGSRAERGRLRRGDRILEINGTKLIGLTEGKVQEYLRRSLEASELRIRVLRAGGVSGGNANPRNGSKSRRRDSKVAEMIEAEEKLASSVETKVATVSPTRKPNTAPVGTSLQVANTRKLGRKIEIVLKKGPNGLGFSVTTRDNPAGGHCPIYIKNILPRGAAIEDGRLKPGDRLLEVDGVPMTGKTQTDVVSILRATQPGATVRLVVSRQQELAELDEREINYEEKERDLNTPPKPPAPVLPSSLQKQHQQDKLPNGVLKSNSARSLFEQHQQQQQYQLNESQHFIDAGSESAASSDSLQAGIAWRSREVLTLHIPVHDTEKAGLGVSVKGKTSSNSSSGNGSMKHDGDLGIFVKNVIHGGAASRDGRLRMNDQLLSVNGVSLLGQNNAEAMETLRRAMVNNPGKHPGMITLSVARKIARSASSGDILEQTNSSSNTSDNSGATVIYLSPEKKEARGSGSAANEMNRWSNPVLDRLTGGVCSSNSSQQARRPSRDLLNAGSGGGGSGPGSVGVHGLRNESYYMATNETWSPALHQQQMVNGHVNSNNTVLIEDDPEPMSPTLPHRPNDSVCTQNSSTAQNTSTAPPGAPVNFDSTYSSQLSLETNNSGVEHFSRDALGRRSISEKHHAALDARETGTYQRNKKLREERERERRIQLTKSAIYGGSMESLTARIANANAQIPGYKHTKAASGVETQQMQAEARDQVGDLGPSLGLKKSSSLESLQTMVQEIQMSDEPRGPTALRAPRGRGREDSLRAAVVADPEAGKPRKHWLLEEGTDQDGGFAHRNGPFQSSLNDGKHKSRAKKPSILRGIGHMFRFGKNRKDGVVPVESQTPSVAERPPASLPTNQLPAAALAALDRNTKLLPPAYQPPPPLPPANAAGPGGSGVNGGSGSGAAGGIGGVGNMSSNSNGIHHNDIFNHRYQHYANYDELHQQQISESENNAANHNQNSSDVLSESTLECMRQQVLRQRIKVEAESFSPRYVRLKSEDWICFELNRRHQHYHSQRSARSQDINLQHHHAAMLSNNGGVGGVDKSGILRPTSTYYEYETVQHNVSPAAVAAQHHQLRNGSLKQNGHHSPITVNGVQQHQQQQHNNNHHHHQQQQQQAQAQKSGPSQAQPHWKSATMNGFSPASLNSSARSRGPFVTHVTIRDQSSATIAAQPTYQTVQKQQPQFASAVVGGGAQPHPSKV
ncbi:partitioning defective 3 homolog isoform X1 [Anastrepha ludens]|uniref:partitioning defective 3 homolog isoform X1 n=1 Tax=Anastrepha ludens TaxID=28586 RepID=UPI0023B0F52F|nr:partitioning defective 3 homolog isoform X1 [Anastrepha ludens]XP_053949722.1 partitioning defective 3 homolog isoform X1 [Anastrepha ludens]XP_053949723.1 partitioning defective 3 homolog isoform X1 [Anastrepha ludens]XP_053949724.1 partitioning defective 3 homolog isoform X1 [Anastrepha ludens]XP_053949725.1 partitioning defective 3 homolog isoform X1 [Anastrepha ludens]XP_053949726.1 partitioning defective 3 homolog isoform X1 [Anastrepha ludens]